MNIGKWNKKDVIVWDVTSYYSYLPALFYENDLTLSFCNNHPEYTENNRMYNPIKLLNGNRVIKTTMGMAVMYLPFFSLAHIYCKITGITSDGFSEPYQCAIQFSGLFYLLLGLFFLRKILISWAGEKVAAWTLLFIVFGTNLFLYGSIQGAMAHAAGFALVTIMIYLFMKWMENPQIKHSILLGVVCGLMVLIRPVNILCLLFPLLFGLKGIAELWERLKFLLSNYLQIQIIVVVAFLVNLPQLVYWKIITGHFLFNSYVGERFYFSNPHLIEGLFGFRKGWLVYSPIMIFSLIGIMFLKKYAQAFSSIILLLVPIYIYVVLSWWCWWYGGSFGLRAMIDIYPFLAISLAALVLVLHTGTMMGKKLLLSIMCILVVLNLWQTTQYRWGIIHHDGMTKEAYFDAFFRIEKSPEQEKFIKIPDYEKARLGKE